MGGLNCEAGISDVQFVLLFTAEFQGVATCRWLQAIVIVKVDGRHCLSASKVALPWQPWNPACGLILTLFGSLDASKKTLSRMPDIRCTRNLHKQPVVEVES